MPEPDADGAWRLSLAWKPSRPGARFRPAQEIDGDTAPDGSLRLIRIGDVRSGRSAQFEPGLVTAPGRLGADALRQSRVEPDRILNSVAELGT